MTHPLLAVMNSEPINRQARVIASQKHCAVEELPIGIQELKQIYQRLLRKQQLLKHVLGVRNRTHMKNIKLRINSRQGDRFSKYNKRNNPAMLELSSVGDAIEIISKQISLVRKLDKKLS